MAVISDIFLSAGQTIRMAGLIVCVCVCAYFSLFAVPLDLVSCDGQSSSCVVTDRNGEVLRAFADDRGIWRYPVRTEDVSPLYIEALLNYEDRFFYSHPGINPLAFGRAFFQYMGNGRVVSGGSTLSMQTARLVCRGLIDFPPKRPWTKKCLQIFRALQLEARFSKAEILNLYLTHAPFGSNVEGVQAAAMTWLGKSCSRLSHAEAALLAVMPQAPSRFRPDKHPKRAEQARNKLLDRMAAFGVWSEDAAAEAKKEPVLSLRFSPPCTAPLAARRLKQEFPGKSVIQTCIDANLQAHAEEMLLHYVNSLPKKSSCAVLVVDHTTMETLVYAGSADFFSKERKGHVDMVHALRSPGSALKPFLYAMAMDRGLIHSHSLLLDTPRFGFDYAPENFTGGFSGPVTVERSLQDSLNLPAIQVLSALGPQVFHDYLKNAGARLQFAGKPNLSLVLGGAGTDLFSLVTLYTSLGRKGISARPRLTNDNLQERYLMSPGAAYIVNQILRRPVPDQQGLSEVTARQFPAWKTGTSFGFRDAWALGVQGKYTAGVWVGRPDGTPSPGQYGAVTALPLLVRILESLPQQGMEERETPPETVTRQTICWPSGMAPDNAAETGKIPCNICDVKHRAWILSGQIPGTLPQDMERPTPLQAVFWVNEKGQLCSPDCGGVEKITMDIWPEQAEPWLPKKWQAGSRIPESCDKCKQGYFPLNTKIAITGISRNAILTLPPGSSGKNSRPNIPLQVSGGRGRLQWFLNRKPLVLANEREFPMPDPGRYELSVTDEYGGVDRVNFVILD